MIFLLGSHVKGVDVSRLPYNTNKALVVENFGELVPNKILEKTLADWLLFTVDKNCWQLKFVVNCQIYQLFYQCLVLKNTFVN